MIRRNFGSYYLDFDFLIFFVLFFAGCMFCCFCIFSAAAGFGFSLAICGFLNLEIRFEIKNPTLKIFNMIPMINRITPAIKIFNEIRYELEKNIHKKLKNVLSENKDNIASSLINSKEEIIRRIPVSIGRFVFFSIKKSNAPVRIKDIKRKK